MNHYNCCNTLNDGKSDVLSNLVKPVVSHSLALMAASPRKKDKCSFFYKCRNNLPGVGKDWVCDFLNSLLQKFL